MEPARTGIQTIQLLLCLRELPARATSVVLVHTHITTGAGRGHTLSKVDIRKASNASLVNPPL